VNTLDTLLGSEEPHATFHDAEIVSISYDPGARSARITAKLCVGDPQAFAEASRNRRRTGVLDLTGVAHWREDRGNQAAQLAALWLADDGPLAEAPGHVAQELVRQLQRDQIGWYFYFADSNSFIYWVAEEARFRWSEPREPAA
jgi:hypothetical protein